jgi:hypothetical protein
MIFLLINKLGVYYQTACWLANKESSQNEYDVHIHCQRTYAEFALALAAIYFATLTF